MHTTVSKYFNVCIRGTKMNENFFVKFIYSEKAIDFCKISTVDLSYVVTVKSTVEILQNFVAYSEYMNFNRCYPLLSFWEPQLYNYEAMLWLE